MVLTSRVRFSSTSSTKSRLNHETAVHQGGSFALLLLTNTGLHAIVGAKSVVLFTTRLGRLEAVPIARLGQSAAMPARLWRGR